MSIKQADPDHLTAIERAAIAWWSLVFTPDGRLRRDPDLNAVFRVERRLDRAVRAARRRARRSTR